MKFYPWPHIHLICRRFISRNPKIAKSHINDTSGHFSHKILFLKLISFGNQKWFNKLKISKHLETIFIYYCSLYATRVLQTKRCLLGSTVWQKKILKERDSMRKNSKIIEILLSRFDKLDIKCVNWLTRLTEVQIQQTSTFS